LYVNSRGGAVAWPAVRSAAFRTIVSAAAA
jgi:hypothetical protein